MPPGGDDRGHLSLMDAAAADETIRRWDGPRAMQGAALGKLL